MFQTKNSKEQKEKQNTFFSRVLTVAILAITLYFLISFVTDQDHPTGKFYNGTITGVYKPEVGTRDTKSKLLVTLDDGAIVKVTPADMGAWQIGNRITVEEMSSMRFRIKTYRFVKYIEPPIKGE